MSRTLLSVIAVAALSGGSSLAFAQDTSHCPKRAVGASFSIWPAGSVKSGVMVSGTHACGRGIVCVGGDRKKNKPRRCDWR